MIISEEEKNRIRGLHKNYPIIKEQGVRDNYLMELVGCVMNNGEKRIASIIKDTVKDRCAEIIIEKIISHEHIIDIGSLEEEIQHCEGTGGTSSPTKEYLPWILENRSKLADCLKQNLRPEGIKEQARMEDGMPILDTNQDIQLQIKQIMDKTNEKVLADIMMVIEDLNREDMSPHEILDRMGLIANKLQNNEYLTI
jgi:hypothetical protein